jgi:L-2-hydroxyglutarate oxidase
VQVVSLGTFDFVIIGGGIVGISTAWQLIQQYPDAAVLLIEKETAPARHQTGHNSGVIHAGVYYAPGSLKADFCKRGAAATYAFCREHGLPVVQCGKLLVATDDVEYERMAALETRCGQNGIETHRWSGADLTRQEPHINGTGALLVPATGITDYPRIASKMAALFMEKGGRIELGRPVTALTETGGHIDIVVGRRRLQARHLVVCGGLMADRLAIMMAIDIDFRIIPFRGEYYRLRPKHNHIVRHLIYPIPDPDLPFLGVHLTRMIDGSVTVGPNAVLGWKREGYGRVNVNLRDILFMMSYRGFWKVMQANLVTGLGEIRDSLFKQGYLKRVQRYCPRLQMDDLLSYPAGIRAQAVKHDGSLVHDFLFAETERSLHVCNAPSPAATSAIPIGAYLLDKIKTKFKL